MQVIDTQVFTNLYVCDNLGSLQDLWVIYENLHWHHDLMLRNKLVAGKKLTGLCNCIYMRRILWLVSIHLDMELNNMAVQNTKLILNLQLLTVIFLHYKIIWNKRIHITFYIGEYNCQDENVKCTQITNQ